MATTDKLGSESEPQTPPPADDSAFCRPCVVVGITGHMDLQSSAIDPLRAEIKGILLYLLTGQSQHPKFGFRDWTPLLHTPLVLMSSLAPGADTLAASIALELGRNGWPIVVKAVLPFPKEIYDKATTFTQPLKGKGVWLGPENSVAASYESLIAQIEEQGRRYPHWAQALFCDVPIDEDETFRKGGGDMRARLAGNLSGDGENQRLRHLRYRAAGEYIAAFSDVLIAIWDEENDQQSDGAGTAAIVRAKLEHLTHGLLPQSSIYSWSQTGPVIHLPTRRAKVEGATRVPEPEVLDPFYFRRTVDPKQKAKLKHRVGYQYFVGHMRNLDDFNARATAVPLIDEGLVAREKTLDAKAFRSVARARSKRRYFQSAEAQKKQAEAENGERAKLMRSVLADKSVVDHQNRFHPDSEKPFDLLARVRRRAATLTTLTRKVTDSTLAKLFWITLLSATLLHIFAHWGDHGAAHTAPDPELHPSFTPHVSESPVSVEQLHFDTTRYGLLTVSILLAGWGLLVFGAYKGSGHESRDYDYRALAEGLRVQIYWAMAGIRESVAANYMQRQRSEMDWIRKSISSLASPYYRWNLWLLDRSPSDVIDIFSIIYKGWIIEQRDFFMKSFRKHNRCSHEWHTLGAGFVCGGMFLSLACLVGETWSKLVSTTHQPWMEAIPHLQIVAAFAGCFTIVLVVRFAGKAWCNPEKGAGRFGPSLREGIFGFLRMFSPSHEDHGTYVDWWAMTKTLLRHFPLAFFLAFELVALSLYLGAKGGPSADHWLIISIGFTLLAGAMCVAWTEKNFYAEHARQYNTMGSLFATATTRMRRHLETLVNLHDQMKNQRRTPEEGGEASAAADEIVKPLERAFAMETEHVQQFLTILGKEALDENAEWLILHRSRPLEPVLAG